MFQSLIGFKINWNEKFAFTKDLAKVFQSLIGFKINWNPICESGHLLFMGQVSIPNRV